MNRTPILVAFATLVLSLLAPWTGYSSDGSVISRQLTITIGHDGIVRQRVRVETRLDSLFATQALADPRIRFERATQELGILKAATLLPNGTVLDAPSRALNTSVPDAAAQCPAFSSLTEVVVSFVAVEPGVVTLLEYEIVDKTPRTGHFEYLAELASELPTRSATLTVRVPGRSHFDWLALGDTRSLVAAEPLLERADSVYSWTAADLPPLSAPPGSPLPDDRPRLLVSTAESWEALLAPLIEALAPPPAPSADPPPAPSAEPPPAPSAGASAPPGTEGQVDPPPADLASKGPERPSSAAPLDSPSMGRLLAAALPPESAPDGESLRVFQAFSRLRSLLLLMPVPLAADRFPLPRPIELVAASRQATPLEAALLAVRLARHFESSPRLVLTIAGPPPASPVSLPGPPALSRIDRVWVEIPSPSGTFFLDSARMEMTPVLHEAPEATLLILEPGRRNRMETARSLLSGPAAEVRFSAQVEGTAGELTVRFSLTATGAASPFIAMAEANRPDGALGLASRVLGPGFTVREAAAPAATVSSYELTGTAALATPGSASLPGTPGTHLLQPFLDPARPGPRPLPGSLTYQQSLAFSLVGLVPVLPLPREESAGRCTLRTAVSATPPTLERSFTLAPPAPLPGRPIAGPASTTHASLRPPVEPARPDSPWLRFLDDGRVPILFVPVPTP